MYKKFTYLFFIVSLLFTVRSSAQTVTWVGGTSNAFFTSSNWNPATNPAALTQNEIMMIGLGSPNDCVHTGGNSGNSYRPAKLNTLTGSNFTVNGTLYPWGSDSLNGNITIGSSGDFSSRNIGYIGRNTSCIMNVNSGTFGTKNACYVAYGNTGATATVNLNGGTFNAGTSLDIANGTGLTGVINVFGGAITVVTNLNIGANGLIHITGIGFLRMTGDKRTVINNYITAGKITCTPGKSLTVTYDGTYTFCQISQNVNSMITEYPDSVVLNTGKVILRVIKSNAKINSYRYRGVELGGVDKMYTDWQTPYTQLSRCVYSAKIDSTDIADISMKQTFILGTDSVAMDHDVHYVIKRNDSAFYMYIVRSHPASYPATHIDENRFVWKLNQDYTEVICVDSARTWQMPNSYDYSQASPTGIAEIIKINTGIRAGQYDCKYEFNKEYWNVGTYGHASNVNKVGIWAVFGGYDFFNDGPTKQDLTSAAGIIHVHFGLDHYMGSNTVLAAGENWSKITGPFMFFTNYHQGGVDSLWADARKRADIEKAQWPYSWLTNEPNYPLAAQRGTVTGKFVISDINKPTVTGAFAMIGLAKPDPGVNWQFDSKYYQYWVKADAGGNFSIPNVRAGTYTLYAYCTGEIGEYAQANIVVLEGATTNLGTVTWTIARNNGSILWEIGVPDRKAQEFRHGDDYFIPYKFLEYSRDFTNPLRYIVGQSNWATDINYAHGNYLRQPDSAWVTWPWNIHFNIASLPPSGNVKLTIAFAGAESSRMDMYINDTTYTTLLSRFYPSNGDGNALLREGIHAKYWDTAILIPVSKLKIGTNVLTLLMGRGGASANHFMYDYISLEGNVTLALPVQYASFTATLIDKKVALNWITSSEVNNHHFEIEKSEDGFSFRKIGELASSMSKNYSFTDAFPIIGFNYYRLKQIDKDGKSTYSEIKKINLSKSQTISIYPNPVKDVITVHKEDGKSLQQIQMFDFNGKLIFSTRNIYSSKFTINTNNLPNGTYIIKVNDGILPVTQTISKE